MENIEQVTKTIWGLLGVLVWVVPYFAVGGLLFHFVMRRSLWFGLPLCLVVVGYTLLFPIAGDDSTWWALAENIAISYLEQCDKTGAISVWAGICTILTFFGAVIGLIIRNFLKKKKEMSAEVFS